MREQNTKKMRQCICYTLLMDIKEKWAYFEIDHHLA